MQSPLDEYSNGYGSRIGQHWREYHNQLSAFGGIGSGLQRVEHPAGIEWKPLPGRRWKVTIRREPEVYYVPNPTLALNMPWQYRRGLQNAPTWPDADLGLQAMDIRSG